MIGDIGLSPASRETAKTNKSAKHYTKTGGQNIRSSLKKKQETFAMGECHNKYPSLTRDG